MKSVSGEKFKIGLLVIMLVKDNFKTSNDQYGAPIRG